MGNTLRPDSDRHASDHVRASVVTGCSARHVCLYRGACEVSVLDCLCEE